MLMDKMMINKKVKTDINIGLIFQLIASLAWVISVFVYGSFELGDYLQLLAASAWTVSNIISFLKDSKMSYANDKKT